jgi:Group II intron, maturase-specific domain
VVRLYTFIADRPIRSLKVKIRALTGRTSQQDLAAVLIRLTQIMRGWANGAFPVIVYTGCHAALASVVDRCS